MITYCITAYNERDELDRLLQILNAHPGLEVIVQIDDNKGNEKVLELLKNWEQSEGNGIKLKYILHKLDNDFAMFKNNFFEHVRSGYIFQIDADEYPSHELIDILPTIIQANPVDLFFVPRINIVNGITPRHMARWGWSKNDNGWINYPDYQTRIYRVDDNIRWDRPVHEQIVGVKTFAKLPMLEQYSLVHIKDIEKQIAQNNRYEKMQ